MNRKQGIHPRARGFLGAWSSGALLWSGTTRKLLDGAFGEAMLAMVALYLCLKHAHLLVHGKPPRIPGDELALVDGAPFDEGELEGLRDRVRRFRDEVMHLSDKLQDVRTVNVSWTTDPPHFTVRSSVGQRGALAWDTMTRGEILDLLDKLDPWLRRQWERHVEEQHDPARAEELAAKINMTMRALGGS